MIQHILNYIIAQIHLINPITWILLFIVSIIFDVTYTKSVLVIARVKAISAANLSVLMYLLTAYGTLNYIHNIFNLIPIAAGAWIGTYFILKYEERRRKIWKEKRDKEKQEKLNQENDERI
jgi:uncharacterized protein YebE (UPF0316 family)